MKKLNLTKSVIKNWNLFQFSRRADKKSSTHLIFFHQIFSQILRIKCFSLKVQLNLCLKPSKVLKVTLYHAWNTPENQMLQFEKQ